MPGRVFFGGVWRPVGDAVALLRVFDHPGHSSQKSHGRRRSVGDLPRGPVPSVSAAAKATNPNYGSTGSMDAPVYREAGKAGGRWTPEMGPEPSGAYEENCTNAVMAFEMRMRGYDVQAAPLDVLDRHGYAGGRTHQQIEDLVAGGWRLPGGRSHGRTLAGQRWRSFDDVDREVARDWPEGGRGFMYVGKHVFSVVKRDGKAQYVESQFDASPNRVVTRQYKTKYKAGVVFGSTREEAKVIRLDDLEPSDAIFEAIVVPEG